MSDLNDFYARYVSKMASYASVKFLLINFTALVPKLDTLMLSATSYGHIVGKMNIQATPGCATCHWFRDSPRHSIQIAIRFAPLTLQK
jgi:hypothetical protein